jgi:hypothetical protein
MVLGYLVQDLVAFFIVLTVGIFYLGYKDPGLLIKLFGILFTVCGIGTNTLRDQDPPAATAKPLMAPCQRNYTEF